MNRFSDRKRRRFSVNATGLTAVLALGLFAAVAWSTLTVGEDMRQREKENLEQVLEQTVMICYSLEGVYPESLEYLKEHYGVNWNEEQYLVDFEVVGSNLPPDITVIARKG